jgi:hypothetical protein
MEFSITRVSAIEARTEKGRMPVPRNPMSFGAKRAREARLRIKRAHTAPLRDEVYCLRYRAYRKEDAIEPSVAETFEDQYDHQPNHVLWALTYEQKVVGSIRTTWFDPAERQPIPEMRGYSDDLAKLVPDGACILSGNRLVTDPDLSSVSAQAVLLLLRHLMVTASQKASDWAVAAARTNHLAFYRRVFGVSVVSESRVYPGLRCPMHLMACDLKRNSGLIMERTPMLKPRGYEQILLDPNCEDLWEVGLPLEA